MTKTLDKNESVDLTGDPDEVTVALEGASAEFVVKDSNGKRTEQLKGSGAENNYPLSGGSSSVKNHGPDAISVGWTP